jgi:hypothetical protein
MTTKITAGKTLYRTISVHINGGRKTYLNRYMEKTRKALITFLRG